MSQSLIPKFDLSTVTNKAELHTSILAWNWDFSLVKLEAPKEFNGVGSAISDLRKADAENGDLHRTARRLGALFEGIPPDVPHLLRAYGTRVSEICGMKQIKPQDKAKHGLFSRFAGPDAASIWAAATSGDNAIAVHLLACMIAEMFEQAPAISLWAQLIAQRKVQLEVDAADTTDQIKKDAKLAAKMQNISRQDLAAWDNSARSWILTAHDAKSKERKRVMLRVDEVVAYVNKESDPYTSVIHAWKQAMIAMDNLIRGIPQRVSNGAILLGMSAWHLYPNMTVLREGPSLIRQDDHLITQTGILTIDLEARTGDSGGIRWSLPLSYMRYYGPPVTMDQRIATDNSRITMNQFSFVLIGCVVSQWYDYMKPLEKAIDMLMRLLQALQYPAKAEIKTTDHIARMQKMTDRSSWIGQLLRAAEEFKEGDSDERETAIKLINNLGRRWSGFLCNADEHPPPVFGLCHMKNLFPLLNDSEHRIVYLRHLAKHWKLSNSNCVIEYRHVEGGEEVWEYASIAPINDDIKFSDHKQGYLNWDANQTLHMGRFIRWLSVHTNETRCRCKGACLRPEDTHPHSESSSVLRGRVISQESTRPYSIHWPVGGKINECPCWQAGGCGISCHNWTNTDPLGCECLHNGLLARRQSAITAMGESCFLVHKIASVEDIDNGKMYFGLDRDFQRSLKMFTLNKEARRKALAKKKPAEILPHQPVALEFCAGDRHTASILRRGDITASGIDPRSGRPGSHLGQIGEYLPAKVMESALDPSHFDYRQLTEWFAAKLRSESFNYVRALRACAAAAELYTRLGPDTSIKASVSSKVKLSEARWIPDSEGPKVSPLRTKLSRSEAFACIAMFESGGLNLDPVGLREVYAMSSGDSIFVSSRLMCDPYTEPFEFEIQRVPGNIGQPGLSFLVPPPDPMVKEPGENEWTVVSHRPFTGELEENFTLTSIHLLNTDFNSDVRGTGDTGYYIDREAALRETVVQVFDGEHWIGDLDVLIALDDEKLHRSGCKHKFGPEEAVQQTPYNQVFEDGEITQIDNWDELFAEPLDSNWAIIRASGQKASQGEGENWLARLAAATISIQLRKETIVLPPEVCGPRWTRDDDDDYIYVQLAGRPIYLPEVYSSSPVRSRIHDAWDIWSTFETTPYRQSQSFV
ncbi:hypothetical protein GGS26DRAFT_593966 [Hypomontagnella submonticulosa]|nr:hypothetical protein GGS26DRAFT_593966 [Hypomontagnella submonticulosa]